MAKIKPFTAFIYNQNKVKDLSTVVCPPYDIISPEEQERYHEINPYNLIHILLAKDSPREDKYATAARFMRDWLKDNVLVRDDRPAVYFYSQQYSLKGEKKTRFGFISLLHLGEGRSSAFAHEHTRAAPKQDRLKLIRQVKANLSPIFAIFADKNRIIQRTYQQHIEKAQPFIDIVDDHKINHKLWRIDDPGVLSKIQAFMRDENIFIADGHHRYEVGCAFRDEMKEKLGKITGEEDFNYILTYFTNTDSRGLTILPVHRLLKLEKAFDLEKFKLQLKDYFDVEEVKDKTKLLFLMEKGGRTEHVIGFYKDKKYWLLRLKNIKILDKMMPDKPKEYRALDVSILNAIILQQIFGLGEGSMENLEFGTEAEDFIARADSDPLSIAFFLNPVKIEQIISVALKGERMPPKSTYFYPKVLSGLVINKFD